MSEKTTRPSWALTADQEKAVFQFIEARGDKECETLVAKDDSGVPASTVGLYLYEKTRKQDGVFYTMITISSSRPAIFQSARPGYACLTRIVQADASTVGKAAKMVQNYAIEHGLAGASHFATNQ